MDAINTSPWNRHTTWIVLSGLLLVNIAFNAILSPMGATDAQISAWQGMLFLGVFLAQPFLLAAWAALGPGSIIHRLPFALAAIVILFFAETYKGWNVWKAGERPDIEPEVLVSQLGLFAIATGVLLMLRRWASFAIAIPVAAVCKQPTKHQFGMKYVLVWMTLCAVLLVIGQAIPGEWTAAGTWADIRDVASPIGIFLLAIFPPMALSLLAISQPIRFRAFVLVFLLWGPALMAAVETVIAMAPEPRAELAWLLFCMQSSAAIAGLVAAFALRLVGYRLIVVDSQSVPCIKSAD